MTDEPRMSAREFADRADDATIRYFRKQLGDILSLTRQGTHSEQLDKLGGALALAQGEFTTPKKTVPVNFSGRSYKYADLQSVYDAVRPALAKHGLAISHLCQEFAGQVELVTMLIHGESGQWLKSIYPVKAKVDAPQQFGSAMTYAKRYSISALLGIASEEDDDAQSAQEATDEPKPGAQQKAIRELTRRHEASQPSGGIDLSIMSPETGEIEWRRENARVGDVREFMRQLETACQHSALYWKANGAQAREAAKAKPDLKVDDETLSRMAERLEGMYGSQISDDPRDDPAKVMIP